jgi:hypothetical protein
MGIQLFEYALDPTLAIGVTNQQSGATLSVQSVTGNPNFITWNFNPLNGLITLAAAGTPGLCVTIPGYTCSGTPVLQLQQPLPASNANSKYQQWRTLGNTTFITSVGCPGMVIDVQNRSVQVGTPIWLYPYNGSPAQQWVQVGLTQLDIEAVSERIG